MKKSDYEKLLKRLEGYSDNVKNIYLNAIEDLIKLYKYIEFNPDKPFIFSDYNNISQEQAAIIRRLHSDLYNEIKTGITSEWSNANLLTDSLVTTMLSSYVADGRFKKYFARNYDALDAFFSRINEEGLNLSQRVWRNASQFKEEIEMAFDIGLREGRSAAELSRDIRGYLQDPEKLFRRVRDVHGNLHLSQRAKAYHPGQGVYRSSYKNSLRLTATQINIAYRDADFQRWQQLDFVVGYEIKRSNTNPYSCIVCETLEGLYPKTFRFVGWHPWCRCYTVPILMTINEFAKIQERILTGEDIGNIRSQNKVTDLPDSFKRWVSENNDKILAARSKPYFIKDNIKMISLRT